MTALAGLLIGDFALLLYFSESKTKSRNSTIVPNVVIYVCALQCKLKVFFDYCDNNGQDKTRS